MEPLSLLGGAGKQPMAAVKNKAAIVEARILENRPVAPDTFLMVINCPEVTAGAVPGQFVKVRTWLEPGEGGSPFLDRPLSIHRVQGGNLSLLYRVVGPATKLMSQTPAGAQAKVSGPLGQGLTAFLPQPQPMYLVAGGIGLAPMALALDWLLAGSSILDSTFDKISGKASTLFYGERAARFQVDETWLKSWAPDYEAMVEDGSGYGHQGLVTAPLAEALAREVRPVFACGPTPMLAAVSSLAARFDAQCYTSVEAGMACGFGVCLSCSLPLKAGGRFRACQEGPVVDGATIEWEKVRS